MKIDILTLFPEMFEGPMTRSIVRRAEESGKLKVSFTNPRAFAKDRHKTVDDRPFGGGAGMVLKAEPLYRALRSVRRKGSRVVCLSPQGRRLDQETLERLSALDHLVLVCGHYEGVDERLLKYVDEEISLGDFVLTGGEIPAMAVVDGVARLLPGVLKKEDAASQESFSRGVDGLLDYPHYTRPRVWRRAKVPNVLLNGDHLQTRAWRSRMSVRATRLKRPDLLKAKSQ